MIERRIDSENIRKLQRVFPVVAILGPRQSGKTTIAGTMVFDHFFDLENPRDLRKLENPQLALEKLEGIIIIDEIQRKPELFPLLRFLVDNNPKQKYVILGSASRDLIRQSSETLAGRIGYYQLDGFRIEDIPPDKIDDLWVKGGFPNSFLSGTEDSFIWREQYVSTFLERDIPQLGINIPAQTLRRFWVMLSHYHSRVVNYAEFSRSFGLSDTTIKKYIDILEGTFMVRRLMPWHSNTKKRLVKSPKIYIRDSGIFHVLHGLSDRLQILSYNLAGASWEGFALEQAIRKIGLRDEQFFFWSTQASAELDLFWQDKGKNWGMEFKLSDAPARSKSMAVAIKDLDLQHLWVVYPGDKIYDLSEKITVLPVSELSGL